MSDLEIHFEVLLCVICYFFAYRIDEYWDPQQAGLDPIVVTRKVPSIHIFLSLDEIDSKTPGFQTGKSSTFWQDSTTSNEQSKDEDYVYRNKKNSNQSRNPRNFNNSKRPRQNSDKKSTDSPKPGPSSKNS